MPNVIKENKFYFILMLCYIILCLLCLITIGKKMNSTFITLPFLLGFVSLGLFFFDYIRLRKKSSE